MVERGIDVVVAEANIRFRAPARFDDVIAIQRGRRALRDHEPEARHGDPARRRAAVEGWLRQVFVDAKTWQKTPIPDWVREALEPFTPAAE